MLPSLIRAFPVGWGNVRNETDGSGSWKLQCQHGELECRMNRVLNCAQSISKTHTVFWPFLLCVEQSMGSGIEGSIEGCAKEAKLDSQAIQSCAKGELGDRLELEAGEKTNNLLPAHRYVPWVVVNGVAIKNDCGNLLVYICAASEGVKPEICQQTPESKACPGAPALRSSKRKAIAST